MKKIDIVNMLAEKNDMTKKAATELIDDVVAIVTDGIERDGKVEIFGFGKFERVERAARAGVNPRTGETIQIAKRNAVKFTPASALKKVVNA